MRMDPQVASKAGTFLQIVQVPFWFKMQSILARVHLRAQRLIWPAAIVLPASLLIQIVAIELLIGPLGYAGIALGWSTSFLA